MLACWPACASRLGWLRPPPGGSWGPNLEYSPEFLELQALALGRPETQFQVAEPPDWPQLIIKAEALLERSRDVRVLMGWLTAQLHVTGLLVLPFGLETLRCWIEQGWPLLNPPLDTEDGNPAERLNALETLVRGEAFWQALRRARILDLPVIGAVELRHALCALDPARFAALLIEPKLSRPQLLAARQSHPERVLALQGLIQASCAALDGLKQALAAHVPALSIPDVSNLHDSLAAVLTLWPPASIVVPPPGAEGFAEAAPRDASAAASFVPHRGLDHGIANRQQALEAIEAVCRYLEQAEPTNPAQWLLKRAVRLIDMNFIALMNDLAPNALSDVARIMGVNPREVLDPDKQA